MVRLSFRPLSFFATAWLVLVVASPALAHGSHDMDEVVHVIDEYGLGVVNHDAERIDKVMGTQDPAALGLGMPAVVLEMGLDRYDRSGMELTLTDKGVIAGPVSLSLSSGVWVSVFDIEVRHDDKGVWKIYGIKLAQHDSEQYFPTGYASQTQSYPVQLSLRDEKGRPVAARIQVEDESGEYWPPRFHRKVVPTKFRTDVGGDVVLEGKSWAYVPADTTIDLPVGKYSMKVAKGMEYREVLTHFEVLGGQGQTLEVVVPHFVNMASRKWYSGDTHIHFVGDHFAKLEAEAEGLNIANILAARWGPLTTDTHRFIGAPSPLSDETNVVYVNQETRHGVIGHTTMLNLKKLVYPLAWGGLAGSQEGMLGGSDYPSMAQLADDAHAQNGLVTWAHFPDPGAEVSVDVALGKIDAIDLFSFGREFDDGFPLPDGTPMPGAVDFYYKFLNTGARVAVAGGTDKMYNIQTVGSVRTYVYTGKRRLSYPDWIEGIRKGRTYVTTGPQVDFRANGRMVGSVLTLRKGASVQLKAVVDIPPDYPADVIEFVQNGKVVASKDLAEGVTREELTLDLDVTESGWVAARVRGSKRLPYQKNIVLGWRGVPSMAHTSPIYLCIDDCEVWNAEDAEFLAQHVSRIIDWAQHTAHYRSDAEKETVLKIYYAALDHYRMHGVESARASGQ